MASKPCCDAGKPVVHDYKRVGEMVKLGDMNTYVVGSGPAAVVVVNDIFGHEFNQVFQVCDRIAEGGLTVACPDVFEGKPWQMKDFPPPDKDAFMNFISTAGDTDNVRGIVRQVMEYLKSEKGVKACAVQGHCWGSTVSLSFAKDADVKAVACCHPAFFGKEKEYAEAAVNPVCILPAGGDPMEDAKAVLEGKPFVSQCVFQRFDDMEHGWLAARGDYTNPKVREAAGKALGILVDFYQNTVGKAAA